MQDVGRICFVRIAHLLEFETPLYDAIRVNRMAFFVGTPASVSVLLEDEDSGLDGIHLPYMRSRLTPLPPDWSDSSYSIKNPYKTNP